MFLFKKKNTYVKKNSSRKSSQKPSSGYALKIALRKHFKNALENICGEAISQQRCRLQEWNFTKKKSAMNVLANFSKELFFGTHLNRLCLACKNSLIHFMPLVSFYILWKHQGTSGFPLFSRGIERDQWHEMGYQQKTHDVTNLNMYLLFINMKLEFAINRLFWYLLECGENITLLLIRLIKTLHLHFHVNQKLYL